MKCELCGGNNFFTISKKIFKEKGNDTFFLQDDRFPVEVRVVLCKKCGWIFKAPRYSDKELDQLYKKTIQNYPVCKKNTLDFSLRSANMYKFLQNHIDMKKLRILDVGGGDGSLMSFFIENKLSVTVLDMDEAETVIPHLKKIKVPFLDFHETGYNLIIMSHFLEHVPSVCNILVHAKKILKNGDFLFVEVPFELTTVFLGRVGDYRHLNYFSKFTLKAFMLKIGFEIIECCNTSVLIGENRIPILRALVKKQEKEHKWIVPKFGCLISVIELINVTAIFYRVVNRIRKIKIL